MGQYHYPVNLTKKEYIHPHRLGDGLKLAEFGNGAGGTMTALAMLLAGSNGRGGGDWHTEDPLIGSWAGDRIAFVGDYAEDTDYPWDPETDDAPSTVHDVIETGKYRDISEEMKALIEAEGLFVFTTADWGGIERNWAPGWEQDKRPIVLAPDMVISV